MKKTTKHRESGKGRPKPTLGENGNRAKRTRNRAAKKLALIRSALTLFASKGFEAATTREIAASAGCAEGLIHRYFKSKAGLLAAMIDHRALTGTAELSHPLRPAHNLEDEFLQLVDWEVERVWESRDFLRVFIPRAIVDPSVGNVMNKRFVSVRVKAIAARLKHYESCVALPNGGTEVLAHAVGMLGLVFGFVRPVLLGHDRVGARKMAAAVAKILIARPAIAMVA